MKHIGRFFVVITIILGGCSENNDLLINQYEVNTISKLAIPICGHIEAFMTGPQEVFIYTGDNNIYTNDNFKTFSGFTATELGAIYCNYELAYYDAENILIYDLDEETNEQFQIKLFESNDYGRTINIRTYDIHPFNDFITWSGNRYLSKPIFASIDNAFVASFSYDENRKLDFFVIDGDEISYLSSITGNYYPVKYKFEGQNGYILMADFGRQLAPIGKNFYFSITSDGGMTWTTPTLITNTQALIDFDFYGNTVITYGNNAAFKSDDKGVSWEAINIPFNHGLSNVDIVNEDVAYLAVIFNIDAFGDISKIYKSTNGGNTWKEMDEMVYASKISFYDSNNGLAMNRDILQVTHNGAVTWEPVIFPPAP